MYKLKEGQDWNHRDSNPPVSARNLSPIFGEYFQPPILV